MPESPTVATELPVQRALDPGGPGGAPAASGHAAEVAGGSPKSLKSTAGRRVGFLGDE